MAFGSLNLSETVERQQAPLVSSAARVKFFPYADQEILLVDFSNAEDLATVKRAADECRRVIVSRPPASVKTLVDTTDTWFDRNTIEVASELAAHNRRYVVRSAVVGVTGLRQIAFNAIVAMTKRHMRLFDTREEALAWLVAKE